MLILGIMCLSLKLIKINEKPKLQKANVRSQNIYESFWKCPYLVTNKKILFAAPTCLIINLAVEKYESFLIYFCLKLTIKFVFLC